MNTLTPERIKAFWFRNGGTICTIGAVGGLATTVYLAVKATPKAMKLIEEADAKTPTDKIKVAYKQYIPTVIAFSATAALIVMAHANEKKQLDSVLALYAMSRDSLTAFEKEASKYLSTDNLEEIYNTSDTEEVDRYKMPDKIELSSIGENWGVTVLESLTGRYFRTSNSAIEQAEKLLNKRLDEAGMASLNDFYGYLGIHQTDLGNMLGWNQNEIKDRYNIEHVVFYHNSGLTDGDYPILVIRYQVDPIYLFDEY